MEYLEWVVQLKSLVTTSNLNLIQKSQITTELIVALAYFLIIFLSIKASRVYVLLAFIFSATIAYTPIYNLLDAVQYHSIFAIIYTSLTYLVRLKKTKVACCMLGSFQLLMAWDSWANATIETFIWANYESIVCLLHALIIGSFLERDIERIKSILDSAASSLRNLLGYTCNQLRLWYYYTNAQIQKDHR